MQEALEDWIKKKKFSFTEKELIEGTIKKALSEWNKRRVNPKHSLSIFCEELHQELRRKGILPNHIETIIKGLKNETSK